MEKGTSSITESPLHCNYLRHLVGVGGEVADYNAVAQVNGTGGGCAHGNDRVTGHDVGGGIAVLHDVADFHAQIAAVGDEARGVCSSLVVRRSVNPKLPGASKRCLVDTGRRGRSRVCHVYLLKIKVKSSVPPRREGTCYAAANPEPSWFRTTTPLFCNSFAPEYTAARQKE